jgi:predicted nucleotidyltransferase
VDPGSTALVGNPVGALAGLAGRTGASFPALEVARALTEERLAQRVEALRSHPTIADVSTCVFGSLARGELTDGSDEDWAVLVGRSFSPDDPDVLIEVGAATATLGGDERRPGTQAIFGLPFDVTDLERNIGLDADTNTNLTRRMLLVLESRELHGSVREAAVSDILGRYLHHGLKAYRPPRFLLNDLVRYWRTICVDFEGKTGSGSGDPKWAMRNAKLRTSRKLVFAGGLVTLLLCHLKDDAAIPHFLENWFDAAPVDRLAAAFVHAGIEETGARTLDAYDQWLALVDSRDVREQLKLVTFENRDRSELFTEIRRIGDVFQSGLDALLFSPALGRVTRRYAIF